MLSTVVVAALVLAFVLIAGVCVVVVRRLWSGGTPDGSADVSIGGSPAGSVTAPGREG